MIIKYAGLLGISTLLYAFQIRGASLPPQSSVDLTSQSSEFLELQPNVSLGLDNLRPLLADNETNSGELTSPRRSWPPDRQWPLEEILPPIPQKHIWKFRFSNPGAISDDEQTYLGYRALSYFAREQSTLVADKNLPTTTVTYYPPREPSGHDPRPWMNILATFYQPDRTIHGYVAKDVINEFLQVIVRALDMRRTRDMDIKAYAYVAGEFMMIARLSIEYYPPPPRARDTHPLPFRFPRVGISQSLSLDFREPRDGVAYSGPRYGLYEVVEFLYTYVEKIGRRELDHKIDPQDFYTKVVPFTPFAIRFSGSQNISNRLMIQVLRLLQGAIDLHGALTADVFVWDTNAMLGKFEISKVPF